MGKRRVYFNEFNVLMEHSAYLPLVSGLLRANAEQSPVIAREYEFMPFLFVRQEPEVIAALYDKPAVAAFSTSMWNEQFNLRLAKLIKHRFKDCLIVFGGPQVPHFPETYFAQHPFVDVAVRGEGEKPFAAILERLLESRDFKGIPNIAWRDSKGACQRSPDELPKEKDLDVYPSPYLSGLFEYLLEEKDGREYQAIVETNRGCPFLCAFCFWGQGGLNRKFRWHSVERFRAEIEWCAKHRIRYVFNADSNFGMHKRDHELAEILVSVKSQYGYPEKFRTCYGKNTGERIFEIGKLLHEHRLEKGITLSRQTLNPVVLRNLRRQNIKLATYQSLQRLFNAHSVPVYTELILALPGETYESWVEGIDQLLASGLKNQLFIYHCQVYPNTTLADPEYQKQFGLITRRIRLTEIHGAIRPSDELHEYEEIIVGTNAMSVEDWQRATVFSWLTMTLISLKLGIFILLYLADRFQVRFADFLQYVSEQQMARGVGTLLRKEVAEFGTQAKRLLAGEGRGRVVKEFGALYWDEEEASFLRIVEHADRFYAEFVKLLHAYLDERGIPHSMDELQEAVTYQRARVPSWHAPSVTRWDFKHNFPAYFAGRLRGKKVALQQQPQQLVLRAPRDFGGDKIRFARETVLWARKSDTLLEEADWTG